MNHVQETFAFCAQDLIATSETTVSESVSSISYQLSTKTV